MVEFLLVMAFYAGTLSNSDAVALTTVGAFPNQAECRAAGEQLKSFETLKKGVSFACIKRTK